MTSTAATEDDTFKALSRPSIHEMVGMYIKARRQFPNHPNYNTLLNIEFMNKHKWDRVEFLMAAKEAGLNIY